MSSLHIFEIFTSIQGESTLAGLPFCFIRLAGCNLRCRWCDTVAAQDVSGEVMAISRIVDRVKQSDLKHVCVTGGEPMVQNGTPRLLEQLLNSGFTVTLETNGSQDLATVPSGVRKIIDIKCPSSGMDRHNRLANLAALNPGDEIKCIIAHRQDYTFAREMFRKYLSDFTGPVLFSPVYEMLKPGELANWILSDKLPVRVHVQLHKILGTP